LDAGCDTGLPGVWTFALVLEVRVLIAKGLDEWDGFTASADACTSKLRDYARISRVNTHLYCGEEKEIQ
jgi:hypothetical protein